MRRKPTVPLKEEVKHGHGFFRGEKCPLSGEEGVLVLSPRHLDQFGRMMAGILRHFPTLFIHLKIKTVREVTQYSCHHPSKLVQMSWGQYQYAFLSTERAFFTSKETMSILHFFL
jgi:hypothetical protein